MKHIIAAGLTAICATTGAWAQSSVTLYGSLDAGIAYISNVGGSSKWMMEQGNMQPDRWGLKGVEDLGGGLKAVFQLENGFYTNTGAFAKSGVLFNRQAFRRPEFGPDRHADVRPSDAVQFRRAGSAEHGLSGGQLVCVPPGQHRLARRHRRRAVRQLGEIPFGDFWRLLVRRDDGSRQHDQLLHRQDV